MVRFSRVFAPTAALLLACSPDRGPQLHFVMAREAAQGRCAVNSPGESADPNAAGQGNERIRISVRQRVSDEARRFVCDKVFDATREVAVRIKLPDREAPIDPVDIYVEGFTALTTPDASGAKYRRVSSAARLAVDPRDRSAPAPVRLLPVDQYRCGTQLHQPRAYHSATKLPDGRVLIFGGMVAAPNDPSVSLVTGNTLYATSTAEIYDPKTQTFTTAEIGGTILPRALHNIAILSDPTATDTDTELLVVGGGELPMGHEQDAAFSANMGNTGATPLAPFAALQLSTVAAGAIRLQIPIGKNTITPTAGEFNFTPAMFAAGAQVEGGGIAVGGGVSYANGDPDGSVRQVFEVVARSNGSMLRSSTAVAARFGPSLTLFPGGRALLYGGNELNTFPTADIINGIGAGVGSGELTVTSTVAGAGRLLHSAIAIDGERALVLGGLQLGPEPEMSQQRPLLPSVPSERAVLVVNVVNGTELMIAPGEYVAVANQAVQKLPSGAILATGGMPRDAAGSSVFLGSKQSFRFRNDLLEKTTGMMQVARQGHTMTPLDDGTILIVGGLQESDGGRVLADVEIYNPASDGSAFDADAELDTGDPLYETLKQEQYKRLPGATATKKDGSGSFECPNF